jgi:hypothetical protein
VVQVRQVLVLEQEPELEQLAVVVPMQRHLSSKLRSWMAYRQALRERY